MRGSSAHARLRSLCGGGYMILTSKSVWFLRCCVAARQPLHSHLLTSRTKGRNSPMKQAKSWFSLLDMKILILLLWILYRCETHLGIDTDKTAWEQLLLHIIWTPDTLLLFDPWTISRLASERKKARTKPMNAAPSTILVNAYVLHPQTLLQGHDNIDRGLNLAPRLNSVLVRKWLYD